MTNKELILEYLELHGKATIRELSNNLDRWIQTPQEYIRQLRAEGHKIDTVYGENDKHGTYVYKQPELTLF